jgi:hypothetical protein
MNPVPGKHKTVRREAVFGARRSKIHSKSAAGVFRAGRLHTLCVVRIEFVFPAVFSYPETPESLIRRR